MTLIISCVDTDRNKNGVFTAASDILISSESNSVRDRNILPLQHGLIVEQSATLGHRVASKAVLFGNYLLQWSGSVDTAEILINNLKKNPPRDPQDFYEIFDKSIDEGQIFFISRGRSKNLANIQAILNCSDGISGWYTHRNATTGIFGSMHITVAGTGQEAFIEAHGRHYDPSCNFISSSVYPAICSLSVLELTNKGHSWDVYGGGYEFFGLKEGGGYRRMSYSICEVSHYDNINSLYVSRWFVSRIIQCIPMKGGSLFQTLILSNPGSQPSFSVKDFEVIEIGETKLKKIEPENSRGFDFGICFAIDKYAISYVSEEICASFNYNRKKLKLNLNDDKIQIILNEYVRIHGADIEIKTPEDLNYLVCSKCGKNSSQMHYRKIKDENGQIERVLHLCDSCIQVYQGHP